MSDDEDFRQGLAAIAAEYRKHLPAKLDEVEALARRAARGEDAADVLREVRRILHGLAGSGATFGLPAVSRAAAEAEALVDPHCAAGTLPDASGWTEFARHIDALRRAGN